MSAVEEAVVQSASMEGPSDDAARLLGRARAALRSGAFAPALEDLDRALELAFGARDRVLEAQVLVEMARGHRAAGAFERALLCAEQGNGAAAAARSPAVAADALAVVAEILEERGDGATARSRLQEAARLLDEAVEQARARGDLGPALELAERARGLRDRVIASLASSPATGERSGAAARANDERQRRERATLEALYESSRRFLEEKDPARVVSAVLDAAIEATRAERGFLLLAPEGEDDGRPKLPGGLDVAAARNFDGAEVRKAALEVSRSIIERALASRRPVLVHDAGTDAQLSAHTSVIDRRLRSVVCLPFESRKPRGVRGVLYLDNRFGEGTFAELDLPLLGAFAGHAALAVENARLAARAERERQALEQVRARAEAASRPPEPPPTNVRPGLAGLVGASRRMQEVYAFIDRVKDAEGAVLVRGESGTGKELVARAIHSEGRRARQRFVAESCAAIPETLIEAALFGSEAGAFTGATARKQGIFELAGKGTIFLDEVGELSPGAQAKLLRVLQERTLRRVGGADEVPVEARLVCATNRDLEAMCRGGQFREDLYYRLNVLAVTVPPLRERREDVPLLVEKFLAGKKRIVPEALSALGDYPWPGNVRELENEVRRLGTLGEAVVTLDDLSPDVRRAAPAASAVLRDDGSVPTLEEAERRLLLAALRVTGGNKLRAAEVLGIPRGTLWHKLRKHKLDDGSPD